MKTNFRTLFSFIFPVLFPVLFSAVGCAALLFPLVSVAGTEGPGEGDVTLFKGMVIRQSVVIKKGIYQIKGADSLSEAAIVIEGENITVDFNGAVLSGNADLQNPSSFTGTGILIKGGKNITLKNLIIKGFKVGVMGRGVKNLRIADGDFSYNFRQRLGSSRSREDLADWQSYHQNEKDEWLRFGAGIYLRDCDSAEIRNNTVLDGQCGLMMTDCSDGWIYNNNFSFNSGIGIGFYRSNRNKVFYNKVDWNVRGFSFGVYFRGQDSAGILVFEQSSNNEFAYNSVTHSGDGFFLWAGQSTLDTGEGGCNDNLIYANDFSYAPTNAVEITFSRNRVIKNKLHDSWHGIWAGFSYNTIMAGNDFGGNLSAIAIEHGQDNIIDQNTFRGDQVGIEIWSQPNRTPEGMYMQKKDTRSLNYKIRNNSFEDVKKVFEINNSENLVIGNNRIGGRYNLGRIDSSVKKLLFEKNGESVKPVWDNSYIPTLTPGIKGQEAALSADHPKGKKFIMMTEWGPYNFRYPILWLTKTDSSGQLNFELFGPQGEWKIKSLKGVTQPSALSGQLNFQGSSLTFQTIKSRPDIRANKAVNNRVNHPGKNNLGKDIDIELEYTGREVVSPFGVPCPAGHPYTFHYRAFEPDLQWKMNWFVFDTASDPLKKGNSFRRLLSSVPVKTTTGNELARVFEQGFGKGIARERIATVATTGIEVPAGSYRIGISASEIAKVFIDGKLIIDAWDPSKKVFDADYHNDAVIKLKGRHTIRVEQAQYGGYGMLFFTINPL